MNQGDAIGRKKFSIASIFIRVLCVFIICFGVSAIFGIIGGLWHTVREPDFGWFDVFGLVFGLIFGAFCGLGIYLGVRAWTLRSATAVRWLLGLSIIVGVEMLAAQISSKPGSTKSANFEVFQLFEAVIAIATAFMFGPIVRWILPPLGLTDDRSLSQRKDSAKRLFGLLGFLFWTGVSGFAMKVEPKEKNFPDIPRESWELITMLGSILVSVLIYKFGVWYSTRPLQKSSEQMVLGEV